MSMPKCKFTSSHGKRRSGRADRSLFKASDELCFNRTVHPSIYRIIAAVGIKAWAMRTRMHDDRLCEERKKKEGASGVLGRIEQ